MPEFWFDTRDGSMLIGEAAISQRLEQSGPGDVVPLRDMIEGDELPPNANEYVRQSRGAWTDDDFVALGSVAFSLVRENHPAEPNVTLTSLHFRKLYELGIGPNPYSMVGRRHALHSFQEVRELVGAPSGYKSRYRFDDWTMDDYVAHARKVELAVGGKPRPEDYDTYAKSDPRAPRHYYMKLVRGGIRNLNEQLGYPNLQTWDHDEYIDFGAKFVEVNGADLLTTTAFDVLHASGRGPGRRLIRKKFGGWETYKEKVLEAAAERSETLEMDRTAKLESYKKLIEKGALPEGFASLDEDELLHRAARHMLIDKINKVVGECMPLGRHARALTVSTMRGFVFMLLRQGEGVGLTAGQIELEASLLGVYDDLWPADQYKTYLKVDSEQLSASIAANTERVRRNRAVKRGQADAA